MILKQGHIHGAYPCQPVPAASGSASPLAGADQLFQAPRQAGAEDPGLAPRRDLVALHGHLLPARLLTEAEAAALARVGEAARACGSSTVEPPDSLVATASRDAAALLARARVALASGP